MKNHHTTRLKQLSNNLVFRYLGLTSILLVGSQVILGTIQAGWDYTQRITNLEQRVEEVANFLSAIPQESNLKFKDTAFTRLLRQTSVDANLVYSVVIDNQGEVLSSFLNPSYFSITFQEQDYQELNIIEIVNSLKIKKQIREFRRPIINTQGYIGEIRLGYSVDPRKREIYQEMGLILLKALLISTSIGVVLFIIFYYEIYAPLQNLAQWTYENTKDDLESPIKKDEAHLINQLETNIKSLLAQFFHLKKQLAQSTNSSISNDSQIDAENLARSRFLAMIGHELRTPLNAVTGMTGLLIDTKLNSQQREFVSIIRSSSENLLTMINNILDFAKIEANKLELEKQPFEIGLCIEEALRLFVPQATEKKLELAYLIEPQTPTAIFGDVTRLRQILVNLLSNAVKFTESGEVVVYVNATAKHDEENLDLDSQLYEIRFAVKDSGIGIPANRMDRLFQSFSQVDASTTRKFGGTGLGLAISKNLTEMMGGKMWVHSVEGKGSTFYCTILAEAAPSFSPANSHTAEELLGGKRLLIIDDNVTNQKILTLQAQSWGMFTCAVESGYRALDWLERGVRFDVAILDMNMPGMDGLTLAQKIRQNPNYQDLPLVMLSSLGKPEHSKQVEKLKFAAILTKPIQQAQLYEILVRILTERPIKITQSIINHDLSNLAESNPLRILVAEDVTVNQEVIRLQLEKLGYLSADFVSNGLEVLQALRRQTYDVILMDVRMPEMDGLTTTYRLQQEYPPSQRPKIIAMTADAMQGDREKCLEVGMDDYLAKPVRLDDLRRTLQQITPLIAPKPILDPKVLDALQAMAGKRAPKMLMELIEHYLEDSALRLEAIANSIHKNDSVTLWQAAHALRSSSLQLGATSFAVLCQEIETIARSGSLVGVSEKFLVLETEYNQVNKALKQQMASLVTTIKA
ncbi:hybrid sensor histidine kinase/response regulator [Aphanothece hegewaldii CCALA 016]|uniref:Circadian input-output histidine kinase CikA n=1 Tax=Aphanothece hegewaldii CCALA 016 TaxID=2107694 RepID=A0A2T1LTU8_9CHRO|nr:response regulator [Aphanothece hegewaldii]PSF34247.1 hybrid sensor histidine kinase/response regulator [Aphanothece hegewaldii CCALA 016]